MTDSPVPPPPSAPNLRIVWLEVAAVFAIGVVPYFMSSLTSLALPPSPVPWPYWLDSLNLTVLCGCSLLATLFIIHRTGEGWSKFGIVPLNGWDAALALLLLLVLEGLWRILESLAGTNDQPLPGPNRPSEFAMMVVRYLFVGFAEELVCRAYLITRFQQLFGNSVGAILIASFAFASYHIHYGLIGAFSVFLIGIVYGIAFVLTRRLWPVALSHALYDIRIEMLSIG